MLDPVRRIERERSDGFLTFAEDLRGYVIDRNRGAEADALLESDQCWSYRHMVDLGSDAPAIRNIALEIDTNSTSVPFGDVFARCLSRSGHHFRGLVANHLVIRLGHRVFAQNEKVRILRGTDQRGLALGARGGREGAPDGDGG